MTRIFKSTLILFVGTVGIAATAQAQFGFHPSIPHVDYVPHTTTHYDAYRHGNHYDYVPHTTTHLDPVLHSGASLYPYSSYGTGYNYQSQYGSYQSYPSTYQSYRSFYSVPQTRTSTHLDLVPHGNHYHVVPHTTSRHRH